jgi:hypothetical protein
MIRDGLTNITKLEFLSCISDVRRQAFKESTIRSAFQKTGIFPFNPIPILQAIQDRLPERTPTPPQNPQSSPFTTPLTLRQINKVASSLEAVLEDDSDLDPDFSHDINRFIRGSLSLATELVQTKRDLKRTKLAEQTARERRAQKNTPLQVGGVLTVEQGREMVHQRAENEVEKARRVLEAAEKKDRKTRKKVFIAAAKEARKWRLEGRLDPAEVVDSEKGSKLRIRF